MHVAAEVGVIHYLGTNPCVGSHWCFTFIVLRFSVYVFITIYDL